MYIHVSMQLSKVILAAVSVFRHSFIGGSMRSRKERVLPPSTSITVGRRPRSPLLYCKQEGGFHDLWSMKGGNTVGGAERRRTEQRRAERFSIGQWFPSTGPFHIIGDAMVVDNIAILRLWWFLASPWPINIGVRRNGRNLHVPQVTVSPEVGEPC